MTQFIYGIVDDAPAIVRDWRLAGFVRDDISVLCACREVSPSTPHDDEVDFDEDLKSLVGIGRFTIPKLGSIVAAGPLLAQLSRVARETARIGSTDTLVELGLPEIVARRYERLLACGHVLVSVCARGEDDQRRARDLLDQNEAQCVFATREFGFPSPTRTFARLRTGGAS